MHRSIRCRNINFQVKISPSGQGYSDPCLTVAQKLSLKTHDFKTVYQSSLSDTQRMTSPQWNTLQSLSP